ncbi:MAG: response regulator [Deltaproteobacteria bacterium]|nr:response regulator [Deltaproteobacteria bacterium]
MSEILLIDAEQPFAGELITTLEGVGFSVEQMEDGKAGLSHAKLSIPTLIVLCVELPNRMSGYSICNKLKKDAELKKIPLIITSSEATPETFAQHKKLKTRAEDYLIKPFSPQDLLDKVGELIELPSGGGGEEEISLDSLVDDESPEDALDALGGLGDDELSLDALGDDDNLLDGLDADIDLGADLDLDETLNLDGDLEFDGLEAMEEDEELSMDSLEEIDAGDLLEEEDLGGLDALDDAGDDLDLGDAVEPDESLEGFDDAFDSMAPLGGNADVNANDDLDSLDEIAEAPSAPVAVSTSGADFEALGNLRKENADLKGNIASLEAKLKAAEEQAKDSKNALSQRKSSGSAREVLDLKEQLNAKDKELLGLRDEVFEKEKAVVEAQEELEQTQNEVDGIKQSASGKDAEMASIQAKLEAITSERDDLEKTVREHLSKAQADAGKFKADAERLQGELDNAGAAAQTAEDQLVTAYKQIEEEEALRQKAREAVEIASALLNGSVDVSNGQQAEA